MMLSLTFGLVLFLSASVSASANKTSSECWGCKPNKPNNLSCTGSSVIVIHSASYGYKGGCSGGITDGVCSGTEINRCCKPGGPSINCLEPFHVTDRAELERTCSSKSTCTFNSVRHDQLYFCKGSPISTNSFTLINYTCQTPEIKTTSRCWGCRPNKPHYLSCTGSSVIVIQSASYGYKGSCQRGKPIDGLCRGEERYKCCTPMPFDGIVCYKSFNKTDKELLERNCYNKSSCNFKNTRLDQPYNCGSVTFKNNSFTQINYTCQSTVSNTVPITSSTKTPIDATPQYDTTSSRTPASKVPMPSNAVKAIPSSIHKVTSGEIGGIVLGVIAIVILLCIASFLLYQRYENTKSTKNRHPEPNRQQSTTRTVGVQYRETDFTDITTSPNITTSSSDTSYSQLNRLGSQPVQYDDLIMNNNNRNSTTDSNYNNYYNQQYVNM